MALEVGSRLGHYDVTALIGEGGMAEVYRARDTKLDRDLALKVSPRPSVPMLYRSNTERVLRPVNFMATRSGTPARTMLRTVVPTEIVRDSPR